LDGGQPVTLCDSCSFGFLTRITAAFIGWSPDEKFIYVPLRYFGLGSKKTLVIPVKPGSVPPTFSSGLMSEVALKLISVSYILNQDNVYPTKTRGQYVTERRTITTNLFRIYLSHQQ